MSGLTLVNPYRPVHFRKLYYKKINLNFYFHNFVWCLKRFYQDTTTKCENENLSHFLSSSRIDTEKVKTLHINFHRTDSPSFSWLYYSPVLFYQLPATLLNPLSASFTKWSNTLKQFVGKLPTNCLSVFDYFAGLVHKRLSMVH